MDSGMSSIVSKVCKRLDDELPTIRVKAAPHYYSVGHWYDNAYHDNVPFKIQAAAERYLGHGRDIGTFFIQTGDGGWIPYDVRNVRISDEEYEIFLVAHIHYCAKFYDSMWGTSEGEDFVYRRVRYRRLTRSEIYQYTEADLKFWCGQWFMQSVQWRNYLGKP